MSTWRMSVLMSEASSVSTPSPPASMVSVFHNSNSSNNNSPTLVTLVNNNNNTLVEQCLHSQDHCLQVSHPPAPLPPTLAPVNNLLQLLNSTTFPRDNNPWSTPPQHLLKPSSGAPSSRPTARSPTECLPQNSPTTSSNVPSRNNNSNSRTTVSINIRATATTVDSMINTTQETIPAVTPIIPTSTTTTFLNPQALAPHFPTMILASTTLAAASTTAVLATPITPPMTTPLSCQTSPVTSTWTPTPSSRTSSAPLVWEAVVRGDRLSPPVQVEGSVAGACVMTGAVLATVALDTTASMILCWDQSRDPHQPRA